MQGGGERAALGGVLVAALFVASAGGCSGGEGAPAPLGHGGHAEGLARPGYAAEPSWRAIPALGARVPRGVRLVERDGEFVLHSDGRQGSTGLAASAPASAGDALRIERSGGSGVWLEVRALGRHAVPGSIEDGAVVYRDAEPATDVIVALGTNRVEELRILHGPDAPSEARYELRPGPGVSALHERAGRIEVLDRSARVVFHTTPAYALDARGSRRAVSLRLQPGRTGQALAVTVDTSGLVYPVVVDPEWVVAESWPAEALVALKSMRIDKQSAITGDVAVVDKKDGGGFELDVDKDAAVTGSVSAHRIRLDKGVSVTGDARFNELVNKGTVGGALVTPLGLPLPISVPALPPFEPGDQQVTVEQGKSLVLGPGSYGKLRLKPGKPGSPTVLRLEGGIYGFAEVKAEKHARIECQCGCEVRVKQRLRLGEASYLGPIEDAAIAAADVEVFVEGAKPGNDDDEGDDDPEAAVRIGKQSVLAARLLAPTGRVRLDKSASVTGTLVGLELALDKESKVAKDEGPAGPDCARWCAVLSGAQCPQGPSEPQCLAECAANLAGPWCTEQSEALVLCGSCRAEAACDEQGVAQIVACAEHKQQLGSCEAVCAATDDQNGCTEDYCDCTLQSCDPQTAISHSPEPEGTPCPDADKCNGDETCNGPGTCLPGVPIATDDQNPCTRDLCDPVTGIVTHPPELAGTPCPDGNVCNGAESCDGNGACVPGTAPPVDDQNPCTADGCDPLGGVS
ncbi:MAG: hypothetical protein HY744_30130, partial [Deltaproteobacteria bacterium]|nr:hypothetical protein [Deltaproteobacteria bacterium]